MLSAPNCPNSQRMAKLTPPKMQTPSAAGAPIRRIGEIVAAEIRIDARLIRANACGDNR